MKKQTLLRYTFFPFIALCLIILNSCEDKREVTFTANVPVYMTLEALRSSVKVEDSKALRKPGKIYFKDNYIYVNEVNKGIHIINNANPSSPENFKFISIPGNVDIAIKGQYLYADSYVDLVIFDIADFNSIHETARIKKLFDYTLPPSDPNYPLDIVDNEKGVVVDWKIEKVTREESGYHYPYPIGPMRWMEYGMMDALKTGWISSSQGTSNASASGTGGSMTRFIVYNDYLYMVSSQNIKIYSMSDSKNPSYAGTVYAGWGLETVFIADNYMYIGSQNGMQILSLTNPANPQALGFYSHVTSCDPVVVEGNYAYVTLRSGTRCQTTINELDVVDISNKANPTLIRSYGMTNPHGLGIENSILFVCDGTAGLKIYDASNVNTISGNMISVFPEIQAFDVIPMSGVLFLIGEDGLFQYNYSNLNNIQQLSVITVEE